MTLLICIIAVVAFISLYDYFSNRTWNQVTSDQRNDIVFEHRNQAYGAYRIRRDYNRRLLFILAGFTAGIGGLYAAAYGGSGEEKLAAYGDRETWIEIPLPKDEKPVIIEPTTPDSPPPATTDMTQMIEPTPEDTPVDGPAQVLRPDEIAGPVDIQAPEDGEWGPPVINPGDGKGPDKPTIVEYIPETPIKDVDEYAEYIGGRPAMLAYMQKNFHYPETAIEQEIEGKVFTQFVVSKEGDISDVTVERGIAGCSECDKEAIRVVKKMPRWKPGKKNGRAVASYFNLPVYFKLN